MITIGEDYAMVEFEGGSIAAATGSLDEKPALFLFNVSGEHYPGESMPPLEKISDMENPIILTFKKEISIDILIIQLNEIKEKFF